MFQLSLHSQMKKHSVQYSDEPDECPEDEDPTGSTSADASPLQDGASTIGSPGAAGSLAAVAWAEKISQAPQLKHRNRP